MTVGITISQRLWRQDPPRLDPPDPPDADADADADASAPKGEAQARATLGEPVGVD